MTTDGYEPDSKRWDAFIEWARRFYEWEDYAEAERNYKVKAGEDLAAARAAYLRDDPDWRDMLSATAGQPHLLWWGAADALRTFMTSNESGSRDAIGSIWAGDETDPRERVRVFSERMEAAKADIRGLDNVGSFLLMAHGASEHPYYQFRPFNSAYRLAGYPRISTSAPAADKYGHALGFLDEFMAQARQRELVIADRLDAQSLVWCVTKNGYSRDDWSPHTREAIERYRGNQPATPPVDSETRSSGDGPVSVELNWTALAEALLWDPADLEEIIEDLEDKRQMIFHGPPGTGKTFVAKRIAAEYERAGGGAEIVQFHPSYAYEDFVEGYRPTLDGGQAGFELRQGPLRRLSERAAANPRDQFVMVIDELNRGNVAKVFGELYFLLEYRDEGIRLQYGDERFALPENLLFICTMNTADRSIALVDAALRRRFWFHGFFPDELPIEGLLRRWLAEHQPGAEWVADLVDRANEHLGDRDAAIGPSYFMSDSAELDDERVRRIWQRAVRPYVEEQCYGEEDKLRSLEYDRLRRELDGDQQPADAGEAIESPSGEAGGDDG